MNSEANKDLKLKGKIGNSWDELLADEFKEDYYQNLRKFLVGEYFGNHQIYPPMEDIFNALKKTPPELVKIVILGQDPYHGEGQAHGYAFSVPKGVKLPPSLRNIFKELYMTDRNFKEWADNKKAQGEKVYGDLTRWAKQGVLLLNTSLTVRAGQAGSHRGRGWEVFTDKIIEILGNREEPCVFILWGNPARAKKKFINEEKHLILEGVHPSPLSAHRGFFGGQYFVLANKFLKSNGMDEIDWRLD